MFLYEGTNVPSTSDFRLSDFKQCWMEPLVFSVISAITLAFEYPEMDPEVYATRIIRCMFSKLVTSTTAETSIGVTFNDNQLDNYAECLYHAGFKVLRARKMQADEVCLYMQTSEVLPLCGVAGLKKRQLMYESWEVKLDTVVEYNPLATLPEWVTEIEMFVAELTQLCLKIR